MAVTQIVSMGNNKEILQKSLQKISTEKIVFITRKDKIKDILSIRNEFALSYRLPTEVKVVGENVQDIFNELKKQNNAVLHIIEHDDLNYMLLNASFLLGIPVYLSNGVEMQLLPGLSAKFKDTLSPDQKKILESLRQECTHEELVNRTKLDNDLLFFYLYGKNSQIGLKKLGLITDANEKLVLTELGKLVVDS